MTVYRFSIFADYFQFIVQDEDSEDDFSALWNDNTLAMGVATGETSLCLGTLRNVDVSVELHVVDGMPKVDLARFDHAVEGSFTSPSGKIVVMGCTELFSDAARLEIASGSWRFIYLISGIHTIEKEWEPADDLYVLYIWPASQREPCLLKHWKPARPDSAS